MEHVLFIQRVKKDKKDDYIKAHKECWPKLLKAIRESGIEREIIWMLENTTYIYMMAENFNKAMEKLEEKKIFKDWIVKMSPLFEEMQDYSKKGKIIKLDKVFDLEEQLGKLNN